MGTKDFRNMRIKFSILLELFLNKNIFNEIGLKVQPIIFRITKDMWELQKRVPRVRRSNVELAYKFPNGESIR